MTNCEVRVTNEKASMNPVVGRRTSIFNRPFFIFLIVLFLLPPASCRRSKARHRLAQDAFFIEILKRENRRWIGDDKFFENCLLKNEYSEVRQWSAIALGRIASPRALPLLCKALKTGDAAVRAASAFAIGEIADREYFEGKLSIPDLDAAAELIRVLDDPSIIVRMRAVEALGKIGSRSVAEEIVQRLESFHFTGAPVERAYLRASIAALAKIGDPIAEPVIEKLADTNDSDIKERVLDALIRIGFKTPDPLLEIPAWQESPIGPPRSPITDTFCRILAANRKNRTIAGLETNRGAIEIELFRQEAPVTVANFVLMAAAGDYNGMEFESVIPHRLIEGISPMARAGYISTIPGEVNMKSFERGSVGMGMIHGYSERGHFFIALTPQPYLDGIHTCFGRVISGIRIADGIVSGDHVLRVTIKETIRFPSHQSY